MNTTLLFIKTLDYITTRGTKENKNTQEKDWVKLCGQKFVDEIFKTLQLSNKKLKRAKSLHSSTINIILS